MTLKPNSHTILFAKRAKTIEILRKKSPGIIPELYLPSERRDFCMYLIFSHSCPLTRRNPSFISTGICSPSRLRPGDSPCYGLQKLVVSKSSPPVFWSGSVYILFHPNAGHAGQLCDFLDSHWLSVSPFPPASADTPFCPVPPHNR